LDSGIRWRRRQTIDATAAVLYGEVFWCGARVRSMTICTTRMLEGDAVLSGRGWTWTTGLLGLGADSEEVTAASVGC